MWRAETCAVRSASPTQTRGAGTAPTPATISSHHHQNSELRVTIPRGAGEETWREVCGRPGGAPWPRVAWGTPYPLWGWACKQGRRGRSHGLTPRDNMAPPDAAVPAFCILLTCGSSDSGPSLVGTRAGSPLPTSPPTPAGLTTAQPYQSHLLGGEWPSMWGLAAE